MDYFPIIQSLLVLGLVAGAGALSRRLNVLRAADVRVLSSFVYYFGLPALFLVEIARLELPAVDITLFWGSLLPLGGILAGLVLLRAARLISRDVLAMLGISIAFGSNAFFGVPFFETLFGSWGLENAVITAAILGMAGIVASTFFFSYATGQGSIAALLWRVLRSPLIISILLGLGFSVMNIEVPILFPALQMVGQTTSATAMFVLGMFVCDNFSLATLKKAFFYTLARVVLLPLATVAVIAFLQPAAPQLNKFLLIQSGIPAAISIGIMAERYKYKVDELTGVVIVSSLFSFVLLVGLYALAGGIY